MCLCLALRCCWTAAFAPSLTGLGPSALTTPIAYSRPVLLATAVLTMSDWGVCVYVHCMYSFAQAALDAVTRVIGTPLFLVREREGGRGGWMRGGREGGAWGQR